MKSQLWAYGIAALLLVGPVSAAPAAPEQHSQRTWDTYQVLVERNIFSRDRARAVQRRAEATLTPVPNPDRYIVLTGIVVQDEEYIAFLEDSRDGITVRARTGDVVARGRLKNIAFDHVEYETNGDSVTVDVGQSLGRASPASMPASGSEEVGRAVEPSADRTPAAAGSARDADQNLLERLRQRRQRELGK